MRQVLRQVGGAQANGRDALGPRRQCDVGHSVRRGCRHSVDGRPPRPVRTPQMYNSVQSMQAAQTAHNVQCDNGPAARLQQRAILLAPGIEWGWPTAQYQTGEQAAPVQIILYMSRKLLRDRARFLAACDFSALHALRYARYAVEGDHLRLTVVNAAHASQLRVQSPMFSAYVRQHAGWHAKVLLELPSDNLSTPCPDDVYVDTHGSQLQRRPRKVPGPRHFVRKRLHAPSHNSFAALATDADEDNADTCPPNGAVLESQSPLQHRLHRCQSNNARHTGPAARKTPASARRARRSALNADYVGTLNVRNLASASGLSRLMAIAQLMNERHVSVLAVQETRLPSTTSLPQQVGLVYYGSTAKAATAGAAHATRTGGTGFLIQQESADYFSYCDKRPKRAHISTDETYAARWGHLYGPAPEQDVWIASVYLPDVGKPLALFADALTDLGADVEFYRAKPGTVLLAGDWNARVGRADETAVPAHLRHLAPSHGEHTINNRGKLMLQWCAEHGMNILSSSMPGFSGPTCTGHGRGQHGTGTSVVDHIVGQVPDTPTAPLRACITLDHAAHAAEVANISSDHAPVLLHTPQRSAQRVKRRERTSVWKVDRVRDKEGCRAYQRAIRRTTAELVAPLDTIHEEGDGLHELTPVAAKQFALATHLHSWTRRMMQ